MPTISKPILTLIPNGTNVDVTVAFDVNYSKVEQFLAEHGLGFAADIELRSNDLFAGVVTQTTKYGTWTYTTEIEPAADASGLLLAHVTAPLADLPPQTGRGGITIGESHSFRVSRNALDEDPGSGWTAGDDEIRARVRVRSVGIDSPSAASDSDVQTLI